MREWQGKRYWLVGASEGLGAALAHKLSRAGVHLILSARGAAGLEVLAEALPGPAEIKPVDVSDHAALERAAEEIGEIDGVIHMAGVYWPFGAQDWDVEQANTMARVNFGGAVALAGTVLPRFVRQDKGHVVLTGSLSGFRGLPASAPYSSSKAGVMVLAESLYADLRKTGVEVQLLNPGFIKTRLTAKNTFKMPFLMEPEEAAQICFEHMTSGGFKRSFPFGFGLFFRIAQFLPDWLYYRLVS
ncbi:SDR family NAD(P)-dependent oxidoreductase [Pacificoceanicola onchidii]|uniref:SDR family NAD(P)-dependent oxidoreductase n=1 Tax=Pacificoceanicola onchidii TaxID=2562685 RepID=UPI0010A33AFD|nr:SDR family NAD(P)-dependent oxidoreductase [Pacificoceanicola onchidii]